MRRQLPRAVPKERALRLLQIIASFAECKEISIMKAKEKVGKNEGSDG